MRDIDVQGFRWTIPSELAPALAFALTILGVFLAWVSPIRNLLFAMTGAIARRLEENRSCRQVGWARLRLSAALKHCTLDTPLPEFAAVKVAAVGSVVALGSLCTVMAIREELLSAELDLPLWWFGTTLALALASFILSFVHWRRGLVRSSVFTLHAVAHQAPLLALIASAIIVTRTARLADIVHMQGGWPQQWLLVHDPALCISVGLALLALVPEIAEPGDPGRTDDRMKKVPSVSAGLMSFVVNRLHLWVQSILLAILVLGGWSIPGADNTGSMVSGFKLLGIAILLVKACAIASLISFLRWSLGTPRLQHTIGWCVRFGVPLSVATSFVTFAWNYCVGHWAITWADSVMHWVVLGLLSATTALMVFQTRNRMKQGAPLSLVSPWI